MAGVRIRVANSRDTTVLLSEHFVDDVDLHALLCQLCRCVVFEPTQCPQRCRAFCKGCAQQAVQAQQTCPGCADGSPRTVSELRPAPLVAELVRHTRCGARTRGSTATATVLAAGSDAWATARSISRTRTTLRLRRISFRWCRVRTWGVWCLWRDGGSTSISGCASTADVAVSVSCCGELPSASTGGSVRKYTWCVVAERAAGGRTSQHPRQSAVRCARARIPGARARAVAAACGVVPAPRGPLSELRHPRGSGGAVASHVHPRSLRPVFRRRRRCFPASGLQDAAAWAAGVVPGRLGGWDTHVASPVVAREDAACAPEGHDAGVSDDAGALGSCVGAGAAAS